MGLLDWGKRWFGRRDVRVVVFGFHSPDWMEALAAESSVWQAMPRVKAVLQVHENEPTIPLDPNRRLRTVILPLMEDHMVKCPSGFRTLLPSAEALQTLRDKGAFAAYVESQGLADGCPAVYESLEEACFPCVLKRTDLHSGIGVEVVVSREEAEGRLAEAAFAGRPYVVQALVRQVVEYVAHCVCVEGRILWHCVYAFAQEGEGLIRRPATTARPRRVESPGWLVASLELFLRPLAFSGPCNVDYTLGADGGLVVFEINPRLGGSLMMPESVNDLRAALACIIRHARWQKCI